MGQLHEGISPEPAILSLHLPFLTPFAMISSHSFWHMCSYWTDKMACGIFLGEADWEMSPTFASSSCRRIIKSKQQHSQNP